MILRQSKTVSYEAPFLYLLFGNERAILWDTGATAESEAFPLRATIDTLVAKWLEEHPRPTYELVVAHTHGHQDHVSGDVQFADRPATVVVDRELSEVVSFFGFSSWPDDHVTYDLGGRSLELLGTPGHHRAELAIYDPWSGFLLTGDTVLPGRLYAFDFAAFLESLERLCEFAETRSISHVMGCHVEMTSRPAVDFPLGARFQPDERPLQMSVEQLNDVRDAARGVAAQPGVHRFDDFIIYNGACRRELTLLLIRGACSRAVGHLTLR